MREFFREGDMVSGEVLEVHSGDGSIMLQTRNANYGKLVNGFYLKVK